MRYRGEQFISEMEIWHGDEYDECGEQQLTDYLDYYHKDKAVRVKEIKVENKTIM